MDVGGGKLKQKENSKKKNAAPIFIVFTGRNLQCSQQHLKPKQHVENENH